MEILTNTRCDPIEMKASTMRLSLKLRPFPTLNSSSVRYDTDTSPRYPRSGSWNLSI